MCVSGFITKNVEMMRPFSSSSSYIHFIDFTKTRVKGKSDTRTYDAFLCDTNGIA